MLPENYQLDAEQKRVLTSMGIYWQEISKRENNTQSVINEISQLYSVIKPIQVLLIVNEYVNNPLGKRAVFNNKSGTVFDVTIIGSIVEVCGRKLIPVIKDKEEAPEFVLAQYLKITE